MTEKELDVWEAAMALVRTLEAWDTAAALQELEDERGQHLAVGVQGDGVRLILEAVDGEVPACGRLILEPRMADEFLGQEGN